MDLFNVYDQAFMSPVGSPVASPSKMPVVANVIPDSITNDAVVNATARATASADAGAADAGVADAVADAGVNTGISAGFGLSSFHSVQAPVTGESKATGFDLVTKRLSGTELVPSLDTTMNRLARQTELIATQTLQTQGMMKQLMNYTLHANLGVQENSKAIHSTKKRLNELSNAIQKLVPGVSNPDKPLHHDDYQLYRAMCLFNTQEGCYTWSAVLVDGKIHIAINVMLIKFLMKNLRMESRVSSISAYDSARLKVGGKYDFPGSNIHATLHQLPLYATTTAMCRYWPHMTPGNMVDLFRNLEPPPSTVYQLFRNMRETFYTRVANGRTRLTNTSDDPKHLKVFSPMKNNNKDAAYRLACKRLFEQLPVPTVGDDNYDEYKKHEAFWHSDPEGFMQYNYNFTLKIPAPILEDGAVVPAEPAEPAEPTSKASRRGSSSSEGQARSAQGEKVVGTKRRSTTSKKKVKKTFRRRLV